MPCETAALVFAELKTRLPQILREPAQLQSALAELESAQRIRDLSPGLKALAQQIKAELGLSRTGECAEPPPQPPPYSPFREAGGFVFCSGQLGMDGEKRLPEPFEEQAHQALANLRRVLEAAGCSMDEVVKVNVYLTGIENLAAFNQIYAPYFPGPKPARAAVAVSALPFGAKIEIEAVAKQR
ncbi:MAG: RidA family protein [Clostridiales bacterium]|nr:RidA family protein [Clostridiales bacterium]